MKKNKETDIQASLEKHWNQGVLNYPGLIIASQAPPLRMEPFDTSMLSMWSAMPVLKKQKAVQ